MKIVKYSLGCLLICIGSHLYGQTNDQMMPSNFPNGNNPTKVVTAPGDTLTGNLNNATPGVDQGTYINSNTDSIRSSSTVQKKTKKGTSKK